jgi:hypothetical protein
MATTTTATRLTLRPTTTTSQSTTPQLGPTTELFTTLPVPTPLPLPTTHTITAQPHPSTPAILRSTNQTTRPSQRPTKHTHLHRPLTTIPSPTLPLTPLLHHHPRRPNNNNSHMSPSRNNHASRTPCRICRFLLRPHCTTSPPPPRSITTTRTMTMISGTRATCPYCAHRLRAHKNLRI